MKDNKNKNKKKLLVLFLVLFIVIGFGGYGVYSYYWTQGSLSGSDTVTLDSFDPEVNLEDGNNDFFLGNGGTVSLTCPNTSTGYGTEICTGSLTVTNNGNAPINVEVLDKSSTIIKESGTGSRDLNDGLSLSIDHTEYQFQNSDSSTTTIAPGGETELHINVYVNVSSKWASDTGYELEDSIEGSSDPVYSTYSQVLVSFKLKASQVHD